ncbi:unnamed protein product [Prorocentrum cordatum]|uniref:Uncharacterized protein n=1 Tax=Prorocentrum cordatum TaxID=2364126 RepID=A0ABN9RUL9_9DINO|nr:unnamed protein product [Polarella glacialis]
MQAQSDVRLGPLQVNMSRPRSVGMCSVDFQKRVLPAFAAKGSAGSDAGTPSSSHQWETPVLSFPLTYVGGGDSDLSLGAVVGSINLSFGVDADPAEIQRVADASTKSLLHRVAGPIKEWVESADPARWAEEAGVTASCDMIREKCRQMDVGALVDASGCDTVKERCRQVGTEALADAARCDAMKDRCRQAQAGALAEAAGCDVVRERCRQIDAAALADAGCELAGHSRPPHRIENGSPQRRATPPAGGPTALGEKARPPAHPLGSDGTAAPARSPSASSLSSGSSSGSSAAPSPARPSAVAGARRSGGAPAVRRWHRPAKYP